MAMDAAAGGPSGWESRERRVSPYLTFDCAFRRSAQYLVMRSEIALPAPLRKCFACGRARSRATGAARGDAWAASARETSARSPRSPRGAASAPARRPAARDRAACPRSIHSVWAYGTSRVHISSWWRSGRFRRPRSSPSSPGTWQVSRIFSSTVERNTSDADAARGVLASRSTRWALHPRG
jgi:hypothetical protein